MGKLIIASNRVAVPGAGAQAGGLAVALSDALAERGGMWCGWSGEISASREASCQEQSGIRYCTFDYSQEEYDAFYLGFSNSHLWPLFHYRTGLSHFSQAQYAAYDDVNARYAALLANEAAEDDVIWVHDYHFIPLGQKLRRLSVTNRMGFFLHIPFPALEVLRTSPIYQDLLKALCAYDVIGFQSVSDIRAFLRAVEEEAGGRVISREDSRVEIEAYGRRLTVGHFPISIDTAHLESLAAQAEKQDATQALHQQLAGREMIIGVDRLDYSKGLLLRLEAYEHFLNHYPEEAQACSYVQITPPSRSEVEEYRQLREELESKAAHINGLHARVGYTPISYLCQNIPHEELAGLYRMARVGLVTPLRDGMNLVAKEYVACQNPQNPGVLILSEFAGAANELGESLIINPHDSEGVAKAIHHALTMPLKERQRRHQAMMEVLYRHTIHDWAQAFLTQLRASESLDKEWAFLPLQELRLRAH